MSRPKKQTVDYFPHYCVSGKTIFILEQEFGNDGYAFWFKLLEILGSKEGHIIDCRNPSEMVFLQAKTRLSGQTTMLILDLLSTLGAIDPALWATKIIWSDNFISNISHVYTNRRVEIPLKPSFYRPKPHSDGSFYIPKPHPDDISTDENKNNNVETPLQPGFYRPKPHPDGSFYIPKPHPDDISTEGKPHSIVDESIVDEIAKQSPKSNEIYFDIEQIFQKDPIRFEQVTMNAKIKDVEYSKKSLRKYHLWLQENEKYPKSKKALVSGFERWLMNETGKSNGEHPKPDILF